MQTGPFYAICVPHGQNGYYFIAVTTENGKIIRLNYGRNYGDGINKINSIAINLFLENVCVLDVEAEIQALIKKCRDKKSLESYYSHGLGHRPQREEPPWNKIDY